MWGLDLVCPSSVNWCVSLVPGLEYLRVSILLFRQSGWLGWLPVSPGLHSLLTHRHYYNHLLQGSPLSIILRYHPYPH